MKIKFLNTAILVIFVLVSSFSTIVSAQQIEVKGKVLDKKDNTTMPGATVMLLHPKDSTFYKFGSTNSDGEFSIKGAEPGTFLLQISFIGYSSYFKNVTLKATESKLDLGELLIESKKEQLKTVEVVEEMVPVIINGDTVEYNAAAFKTQPEANVADLLKQLPGVEVDKDGTVTAQGEEVKKVLVDGKEFFGDDTKLATENLPADMVKKVQIYDDQSDASKMSGIDDGDRTKTINLKIKKDRKKGVFGNATAGGGLTANDWSKIEDEKGMYNEKFNLNKFTNTMQLSTLGMLNNTNEQGFSYRDYINFAGGGSNAFSGSSRNGSNASGVPIGSNSNDGFTKTGAAGINLNYDLTPSANLSSSYFYNEYDKDLFSTTDKQYIADSNNFNSNQIDNQNQFSRNHRINAKYKQKIDSTQNLTVNASFTYADGHTSSTSDNSNISTENVFLSSSSTDNNSTGTDLRLNGNLTYGKRFKKKGRSFVTNLTIGNTNNEKNYGIESNNIFASSFSTNIIQSQNETNSQVDYSGKVNYTEPIGKSTYLEFNYQRQNYNNNYKKDFFDIPTPNNEIFNSALSLDYDNTFVYDKFGLNTKINTEKSNLTAGGAIQRSDLDGKIKITNFALRRINWYVLPKIKWNHRFNASTRLNFNYSTNVNQPSLDQLQPTLNNSNPLSLYQGNPDLKNEYSHNARVRLMSFNQFSFTNVFAMLNATYTTNKITNSQTIDSRFIQTTKPLNVKDDYLLTAYLYFGTPIRPIKSKINIRSNSSFNRSILFVNTNRNFVRYLNNGINFSIENRKKDIFDTKIGSKLSFNTTTYSVSSSLNQNYFSAEYYGEFLVNFLKTWTFSTEANFTNYFSDQFTNNPNIPIWKAYISKRFLKGNNGLLKLYVFDILNQNVGINRTSQANYIQDQRVTTLSRYVMLSFTYKIMRFGGKKKKVKTTDS